MTLDIAAIKARENEATEGPWEWRGKNGQLWSKNADGLLLHPVLMPIHEYECGVDIDARDENMDFIAHARTDIPALIAALEATEAARVKAEQERDALKEALKPFAHTVPYDFAADHEPVTFTATGGEFRAACRALEAKS